jgi:hypothetical protein
MNEKHSTIRVGKEHQQSTTQHNTSWKRASTKHNTPQTMELGKTNNICNGRDKTEHTIR